jgi:copper chaperone CopZ
MAARVAVEKVPNVTSVATDMNEHTVTVEFDDDQTSIDDIVKALGTAGYTVPSYSPES